MGSLMLNIKGSNKQQQKKKKKAKKETKIPQMALCQEM